MMIFDLNFAIENFYQAVLGIPTTLLITFVAVAGGLPLGFFIAVARINKVPVLNKFFTLYISFLRGTPVIVQIFLVYNSAPSVLNHIGGAFKISYNFNGLNPVYYAFLVFVLNASAGFAEMWKSALSSVGKGQLEAAQTVGLTNFQAFKGVIIPQALAAAAPSLCSTSLSLLKNTSLVFIMTVQDITAKAKIAAGQQYKYVEGYMDIVAAYIIVCSLLEILFKLWEKNLTEYRNKSFSSKSSLKIKGGVSLD